MLPVTLFYSWQMDRPSDVCRTFIGKALDEAVTILADEGEIALKIDSDTKDEPGTPPISETILRKIRECDIFLGDMTFVAQAGEKLIPNPNVMGEYGYALHAKGLRRILLVMNEAYGPAKELPFDLHHLRHPERYTLAEDVGGGARRDARKALGQRLAAYIKLIAKELAAEQVQTQTEIAKALSDAWWTAVQQRPINNRPALVSPPTALVHVMPAAALGDRYIGPHDVKPVHGLLRVDDDAEAIFGTGGQDWFAHSPKRLVTRGHNEEATWYGRLLQPGVVEYEVTVGELIDDDPAIVVKGKHLEWMIVTAADRGLALAAALNLQGPSLVGVVLYGLENVELSGPYRTRKLGQPSLALPTAIIPPGVVHSGDHLRRAFDTLWMMAGFDDGSPSYAEDRWAGYDSGGRHG